MLSNKYSEIRGNIRIAANSIGTSFRLGLCQIKTQFMLVLEGKQGMN